MVLIGALAAATAAFAGARDRGARPLAPAADLPLAQPYGGTGSRQSGLQVTPDGKRVLINKDVRAERWAITRNEDGTVTGNVFRADGAEPVFIFCSETNANAEEVTLRCQSAAPCSTAPCPASDWTLLGEATLPRSFFEPAASPPPVPGALGRRRFSIDPATSFVRSSSSLAAPVEIAGLEGWLELEAGAVDPSTGIAVVDIVGASPVIAVEGFAPGVGPIAYCIVPEPGQLPIRNAGVVDCDGGTDVGYALRVDHNIGVVGAGGFTALACEQAGGSVEGPSAPHPGVCNGGFETAQLGEDSGPGALLLAPDVVAPGGGFNVRITTEAALPCGDEAVPAFDVALVLTTARTRTSVVDERNVAGATLEDGIRGEGFSCARWTAENGPGAVTFSGFALDYTLAVAPDLPFDAISIFFLRD